MTWLFIYLAIALVFSFFCSLSEATLLSVRPAYVEALAEIRPRAAARLRSLLTAIDRPLSAILTLNTVAHTVGAAGVGAQAAKVFGDAYLGATSAVLTLLILVISEIIPKSLGAAHWRGLAPPLAPALTALTTAFGPLVWMSARITALFAPGTPPPSVSRDEVRAMAELGLREGRIAPQEFRIVANLLRLRALSVRDIMTPRPVIFSVPKSMTVRDFFTLHGDRPFSRIPVYDAAPDDIIGYVLKMDLLKAQAEDEFDRPLSAFRRDFLAIPDFISAAQAFERLMHESTHAVLVVDEYGAVQGLVTLEDIVETLIGLEITDETDTVEDMQKLARERWRARIRRLGLDPGSLRGHRAEGDED